jgi:hypothetical protein
VRDSVLILANDDVDEEDEDEILLPDIDGDKPGKPPLVDPLLFTLVVVAVESRLEDVLLIESLDNRLSLEADERNNSVSSSVIGEGPTGSGGSGPEGGKDGGGFEGIEGEVGGFEDGWPGMKGVRGEGGMKEGGAGNDSRSSGTIAVEILDGLRGDMGGDAGGGLGDKDVGMGG